ncbi:hypothetical protein M378DRAFT_167312, partial [Amanita muscaria Koide BX008]
MQGRTPFAEPIANDLLPSIASRFICPVTRLTVKFGRGCISFQTNISNCQTAITDDIKSQPRPWYRGGLLYYIPNVITGHRCQ